MSKYMSSGTCGS